MIETLISPAEMELVFETPASLTTCPTHYCPGCTHGIAHRLLAECLDELNLRERTVLVGAPVGCSVFAYNYFDVDTCVAAHGRAPAMATGIKRVQPNHIVVTYQGDGDLVSIGAAEILHAAGRGENITAIFLNNAVYGMTGGQMAPTSLVGQVTTSSPLGRDTRTAGYPIRMSELLSGLDGTAYIVRRSLHDVRHIRQAKKAIMTALRVQMSGLGFSMVELLSSCPTNWGLTPRQALQWIEDEMLPYYPVGDYKVVEAVKALEKEASDTMFEDIVFAGSGGQGVMFAGQLLAYAAMDEGLHVTWIPSYGPEMRGGTAHCFVVVSDRPIGSPLVKKPKLAIVFNDPSFDKYEPVVAPGGVLVVNSAIVSRTSQRDDLTVLPVPATRLASELGDMRLTNMVLLGAALTARPILPLDALRRALENHLPEHRRRLLPLNLQALQRGADCAAGIRAG